MNNKKRIAIGNTLGKRCSLKSAGLSNKIGKSGQIINCTKSRTGNKTFFMKLKTLLSPNLPSFTNHFKNQLNQTQKNVVKYFENFPYNQLAENYSYLKNTPYAIIKLRQKDFDAGTVRLTVPGIYIFQENIIFNPNESNDFMPTMSQMSKYPMGSKGPYHLGFFAALTIESDNILLDLNNKTISQSRLHNIEQRFYANIELASSPFIPKQGPANFGDTIIFPKNVCITNGTLGLSSHHGIHGNKMENVLINNITIKDFEVAGIALNGTRNSVLTDITMTGTSKNIKVLSTYSSARFIRRFLKNIERVDASRSLNLKKGNKTIGNIIIELENDMTLTRNAVINNVQLPNNLFKNTSGLYDGNVYGLVLNKVGVVIQDFITTLGDETTGNRNIYLNNIIINNITSIPEEIVGVNAPNPKTGSYGKGVQVGPVGDVLQISNASNNDGTYKENVLSNAKIILGKYNNPKNGTTNITSETINWAENGNQDIRTVVANAARYFTFGGDSMAHLMKGNIGLFISSGKNITVNNVVIKKIVSDGNRVGVDKLLTTIDKKGANAFGSVITGSSNIKLTNLNISDIGSKANDAVGIMIKSSSNIIQNGTRINRLVALKGNIESIRIN
jgi:hypothetical protein